MPLRQHSHIARFFACLAIAALLLPTADAGATARPDVLILHSFHDTLPWSHGLNEGIAQALADSAMPIERHVEYLDSLRRPLDRRLLETIRYLEKKYQGMHFDGILATDDVALDFVLEYRARLFPGVPVVFCAPNDFSPARIQGHRNITGVAESPDFAGTIDIIHRLNPGTSAIYVITDRTLPSLNRLAQFEKDVAPLPGINRIIASSDESFDAMMAQARAQPDDTALLFLNFLRDRHGSQYGTGTSVLERISAAIDRPVYTYKKIDVGHGAVGGSVISEVLMAAHAAGMLRRILEGTPADDIPIVTRTPTVKLFDFVQLKRFDIPLGRLPEGSVVINRPFSFYGTYRRTVWTVGGIIIVLAVLVVWLTAAIIRRTRVEKALTAIQEDLEQRVSQRTADLQKVNDELLLEITTREAAETALKENEERYRTLADATFEAVFISESGFCTDANRTASRMFGFTRDEFTGVFATDLFAETSKEIVQDNMLNGSEAPYEAVALRKDGSTFDVEICARTSEYRGRPVQMMMVRDISAQKQAEQEKAALEAKLHHAQKMEALGTLAGGVAHDFNNLLMVIGGNVDLIKTTLPEDHPVVVRLKRIEESVASAARLTTQLLGYARKGRYALATVDLNRIVERVAETIGRTHKEVSVETQLETPLPGIHADATQMEQVLFNLCINAVDAMPDGGRLLLQTAATDTDPDLDNAVVLRISDTGTGMDDDIMSKIFDPFFTTKEMGRGTGLGLASVYGIVSAHGGRIDVASRKGRGTSFIIRFAASATPTAESARKAAEAVGGTDTILLVDDEDIVSAVTAEMLAALGYHVVTAASGREAIDRISDPAHGIDLVILDLIMPGMSGSATFDGLREIDPALPILLSSGYSAQGQAESILKRGGNGFIQKPFDLSALASKIRAVLGGDENAT